MTMNHGIGAMTLKETRAVKLRALASEAAALSGTAQRVEQAAIEALMEGNDANLQSQMAYMSGALSRILKDWGAIEHMQGWKKDRWTHGR